jgi:hypothetical protein
MAQVSYQESTNNRSYRTKLVAMADGSRDLYSPALR